jgi:hypothetical protein
MSKAHASIVNAVGLAAFAIAVVNAAPAFAGSQHLVCGGAYKKVATYNDAIKCRKISFADTAAEARVMTIIERRTASCNAHASLPKFHVIKVGSRFKVQAAFVCANIT